MPRFCPEDCKHLSPTEEEQNANPRKYSPIMYHRCKKYDVILHHGKNHLYHPRIVRFHNCTKKHLINWCHLCGKEMAPEDFEILYIKNPHFTVKGICPNCMSRAWIDRLCEEIETCSKRS